MIKKIFLALVSFGYLWGMDTMPFEQKNPIDAFKQLVKNSPDETADALSLETYAELDKYAKENPSKGIIATQVKNVQDKVISYKYYEYLNMFKYLKSELDKPNFNGIFLDPQLKTPIDKCFLIRYSQKSQDYYFGTEGSLGKPLYLVSLHMSPLTRDNLRKISRLRFNVDNHELAEICDKIIHYAQRGHTQQFGPQTVNYARLTLASLFKDQQRKSALLEDIIHDEARAFPADVASARKALNEMRQ